MGGDIRACHPFHWQNPTSQTLNLLVEHENLSGGCYRPAFAARLCVDLGRRCLERWQQSQLLSPKPATGPLSPINLECTKMHEKIHEALDTDTKQPPSLCTATSAPLRELREAGILHQELERQEWGLGCRVWVWGVGVDCSTTSKSWWKLISSWLGTVPKPEALPL